MELGLREWLILVSIVIIAAIVLDGLRRMSANRHKLKFKLKAVHAVEPDDPETSELSDGLGAIRAKYDPIEDKSKVLQELGFGESPAFSSTKSNLPKKRSQKTEPTYNDETAFDNTSSLHTDTSIGVIDASDGEGVDIEKSKAGQLELTTSDQAANAVLAELDRTQEVKTLSFEAFEEVLIINVVSRDPLGFSGAALLQNILESGLRFGQMDIFHRHESMTGRGEILFSMANGVKPGTFCLTEMEELRTPIVSFFLGLPGPRNVRQAFDVMLAASRKLGSELDGIIKDESRNTMTAQTLGHYRQRISNFEHRRLVGKKFGV